MAVARPAGEFRFGLEVIAGRQRLELDRIEVEALQTTESIRQITSPARVFWRIDKLGKCAYNR